MEGPADRAIVFASEKERPGFFVIDGRIKIAKTGDTVGSPIFVNLDLLYPKSPDGSIRPLSLSSAVAILVHELGHHHGETDHLKLDFLGPSAAVDFRRGNSLPLGERSTE